jgi:hypothetical protein
LLASIKPFLKNVAAPALKSVGKEVTKGLLRSGVDIGERVLQGDNFKSAVKDTLKSRGVETLSNIGGVLKNQIGGRKKRRIPITAFLNSVKKRRIQRKKDPASAYRNFLKQLQTSDIRKIKTLHRRPPPPKRRKSRKNKISKTRIAPKRKRHSKKKTQFPGLY